MNDIQPVQDFLRCATPQAWIDNAIKDLPTLIIDHANCEKKAASTALNLMYRYVDRFDLLNKMSRLAREELRHFNEELSKLIRGMKDLDIDGLIDVSIESDDMPGSYRGK